jgi:branched-subunit amino acid aminotransferase/4-amino-4-deoxychorismate lyase
MPDIVIIPAGESTPMLPNSSAFAHGFGLFETMHYAAGRLHFWRDHWQRLTQSARHFTLAAPTEAAALAALRELVATFSPEQATQATLKLSLVKEASEPTGSRLYVYTRPPQPAPASRRLLLDSSCPIFERSLLAGHKTHNYMESIYLLSLARARGDYDTLRVDSQGHLAETTTANLFFLKDGRIHTPSLATGILPGVTRAVLLGARELGIEEGSYLPESLLAADAIFVTNATSGVQAIERIEGFTGQKTAEYPADSAWLTRIRTVLERARAERAVKLI